MIVCFRILSAFLWESMSCAPRHETQYERVKELKVDTEMHIVLPGCSTKRETHDELLKEDGHEIRF